MKPITTLAMMLAAIINLPTYSALGASPTNEELVVMLGDDSYQNRAYATRRLYEKDVETISILQKNLTNKDPEIALRCKDLIERMIDVRPVEGEMPVIWDLPMERRYTDDGMFYHDIAKEIFDEITLSHKEETMAPDEWAVLTITGSYWTHIDYKLSKYAQEATAAYIGRQRLAGMGREDAFRLLADMQNNERIYFHVAKGADNYWFNQSVVVPSPLLERPVFESNITGPQAFDEE